tara:strand:- start:48 stop:320 length:273 start_codon:yes stop_codon:yes gene_type:complete
MSETTLISDGLEILNNFWKLYFTSRDPNVVLQGLPVVDRLMDFNKECFTNDEIDFMNRYKRECEYVIRPENYLGYGFPSNSQNRENDDAS